MLQISKPNLGINYKRLARAVVGRAYKDIAKPYDDYCTDIDIYSAMVFILSEPCEWYCLAAGIDCKKLRKQAAGAYRRLMEIKQPA